MIAIDKDNNNNNPKFIKSKISRILTKIYYY